MKRHLGISAIAAAAVGLSASIAGATITLTSAHVENDYTYDFPGGPT